jgi:hypothetical protein
MDGWMDTNIYIACLRQVVAFAPKVIKCAAYGVAQGRGCGFSSLMKQNKKAKNYAVFCFAGKKKLLFYIYAVIVKQIF